MLNEVHYKRILEKFKKRLEKADLRYLNQRDWIERFKSLTEQEQLRLIQLIERSQSQSIVKGIHSLDPLINLTGIGNFNIKPQRRFFVDNKEKLEGLSREEKKKAMYEHFGYDK